MSQNGGRVKGKHAAELARAAPQALRADEAGAIASWRLERVPTPPPVAVVAGEAEIVELLLSHLDGHPELRVLPLEGWPVLRSSALEECALARAGDPDTAPSRAAAALAGWIDEQGPGRLRARWVIGANLPTRGAEAVISVDGAFAGKETRSLDLGSAAIRADPGAAAEQITRWLGVPPYGNLRRPTRNARRAKPGKLVKRPQQPPALSKLDPSASALVELAELAAVRRARPVPVDQPLVLISQIQRSGGHLLNQLFDGHPEVHSHPRELLIGYPHARQRWPILDPSSPAEAFERLYAIGAGWLQNGYGRKRAIALGDPSLVWPFLIAPSLVRAIFLERVAARPPESARELLDAWFTAFFNGWLDNANLVGAKKWVVAFAAMLMTTTAEQERFFDDYPDGRLVGIVRDPVSWWASARAHKAPRFSERDAAIEEWSEATRALIAASETSPKRTMLVDFRELLTDPGTVARRIARWLGIGEAEYLSEPTFNGWPMSANSSFPIDRAGVLAEPLGRGILVSPEDRAAIQRATGELYAAALELASGHAISYA